MVSTGSLSPTAETIFFTAMDLFRENGYIATNIRQIAERAGVSLGLVNHYFGSGLPTTSMCCWETASRSGRILLRKTAPNIWSLRIFPDRSPKWRRRNNKTRKKRK